MEHDLKKVYKYISNSRVDRKYKDNDKYEMQLYVYLEKHRNIEDYAGWASVSKDTLLYDCKKYKIYVDFNGYYTVLSTKNYSAYAHSEIKRFSNKCIIDFNLLPKVISDIILLNDIV